MKKILIAVLVTVAVGFAGTFVTTPAIAGWYTTIVKPSFNPPNWLFGPVWTILYILMGVAAGIVWNRGTERLDVRRALAAYGVQLGLNVAWSFIFFGMHNPAAAFAEIVALWLAIVITMVMFKRVAQPAAWLLAPYLGWVSFAAVLNYSIWMLN